MGDIRVGVIGVGRGSGFARGAGTHLGMELVALCDTWEEKLQEVGKQFSVTTYTDYDRFLEHDMDAVILANYFHQHAPYAIKALQAGKHVMSETAACSTLAEGVALIEAVEKSGRIYMFAENYPYMVFNQEMRRLYQQGKVGTFMYGEGEYVHSMHPDNTNRISPGADHWRNWIPATYYCTHALAPIMYITDTQPVWVNAQIITYPKDHLTPKMTAVRHDAASVIVVRMDNGAVAKLLQVSLRGDGVWVRIHGSHGLMENLRTGDSNMVRLVREQYCEERTDPGEQIYRPDFPVHHEEAMRAGHGGGDFFKNNHIPTAKRTGKRPTWDVYRGVACSIVGPLAYRSALKGGDGVAVPDLRKKSERKKYVADEWTPDPARRKRGYPWPSVEGDIKPTARALAYARKVWKSIGYEER